MDSAKIRTCPEMNETIKDLLRRSEEPMNLYILTRIEELERQVAAAEEATPPNDPLTLEELREMDGEPVWISYFAGGPAVCVLVDAKHDVCRDAHGGFAVFENLGNTWMAYRRKPKEGTL